MRKVVITCALAVAAFALGVALAQPAADCPAHVTALMVRA